MSVKIPEVADYDDDFFSETSNTYQNAELIKYISGQNLKTVCTMHFALLLKVNFIISFYITVTLFVTSTVYSFLFMFC